MATNKFPGPGELPIPAGTVRLFHYTKGDTAAEAFANLAAIGREGLRAAKAQGHTYAEPDFVWACTKCADPHTHLLVEFWARPEQIDVGAPWPWAGQVVPQADLDEWMDGNHNVTLYGDVSVEQIVALHEPWQTHYRYIAEDEMVQATLLRGEYAWLEDDDLYIDVRQGLSAWAEEHGVSLSGKPLREL